MTKPCHQQFWGRNADDLPPSSAHQHQHSEVPVKMDWALSAIFGWLDGLSVWTDCLLDGLSVWLDDCWLVGRIVRWMDCLFGWMILGWLDGLSV